MSSALRKNAPLGPTGNLRRSVKTKKLKPLTWNSPAASIAAIDMKIAPHAILVEQKGRSKGYFRRTVDENSQVVIGTVKKEIEKINCGGDEVMHIEEALSKYLSTCAGLTALVATRIYPGDMPESCTKPAIAYARISTPREHTMGIDPGLVS